MTTAITAAMTPIIARTIFGVLSLAFAIVCVIGCMVYASMPNQWEPSDSTCLTWCVIIFMACLAVFLATFL